MKKLSTRRCIHDTRHCAESALNSGPRRCRGKPDGCTDGGSSSREVQSSFVDDPKLAVRHGDELVAQVMKSLAESFSKERAQLEGHFERPDEVSTENLRVALRQYRSFFERLLSL
jgi:hypothetical protein